jgi:hypothetical protein
MRWPPVSSAEGHANFKVPVATAMTESKDGRLPETITVAVTAGYFSSYRLTKLTDKDTVVLAEWTDTTGDTVFDGTLRQGGSSLLEQSHF